MAIIEAWQHDKGQQIATIALPVAISQISEGQPATIYIPYPDDRQDVFRELSGIARIYEYSEYKYYLKPDKVPAFAVVSGTVLEQLTFADYGYRILPGRNNRLLFQEAHPHAWLYAELMAAIAQNP